MPQKLPFTPTFLDTHCIIDVRTPLEYAEDHLPGAINVPILTNEERIEIGTIHKQVGPREARMRGLELTCGRFADLVRRVIDLAAGRTVLAYCWRGGLRSRSMAILLEMSGHPVVQLEGGYKAFRAMVLDYFETFTPPAPLLVIHGMTGTGKTGFINGLDRQRWSPVDLEGLACHRGSAFGQVGLDQSLSQKRFDTLLWDTFRRAEPGRPIVLEGESQRIGRIILPGRLYQVMSASRKVWCHASLDTRVERLTAEYAREEYRQPMLDALERIRKKLGSKLHDELVHMLVKWDVEGVCRVLVEQYYDKLYYRHRPWVPDVEIELEDFALAEERLGVFWNAC